MRVAAEGLRDEFLELRLDRIDILAGCEPGSVAHPEDVGVDRERLLSERSVEHDIGGLASDSRQRLQLISSPRNLATMVPDQCLAERDDVPGLGVEQADRLDRLTQPFLAVIDHLPRGFNVLKQGPRSDVDAGVGGLRRQHDGDEQLIGIRRLEFGRRRGVGLREPEPLGLGVDQREADRDVLPVRGDRDRRHVADPHTAVLDRRADVQALDRLVEVRVVVDRRGAEAAQPEREAGDHQRGQRGEREQAELEVARRRRAHTASATRVKK